MERMELRFMESALLFPFVLAGTGLLYWLSRSATVTLLGFVAVNSVVLIWGQLRQIEYKLDDISEKLSRPN